MSFVLAIDQGTTVARHRVRADCPRSGRRSRSFPSTSPLRLGRARAGGDLARRRHLPRRAGGAGLRRRRSPRSASPTSARRPSCGTARPGSPSTARSSGRTAAPPISAPAAKPTAMSRRRGQAPGWCSTPTSPAPRSPGCSTTCPGARARAEAGELAFGTVDTWLVWRLTGGRVHATDVTNASRTMLFNIHTRRVGRRAAATAARAARDAAGGADQSAKFRRTATPELFGGASPIAGIAGDQQAALFGQGCFAPGMDEVHLRHRRFAADEHRREPVASTQHAAHDDRLALDGAAVRARGRVFIAGAAVQWLRDGLGIIQKASETRRRSPTSADR